MRGRDLNQRLALHRRSQVANDFTPSDERTVLVAEVWAGIEWKSGNEAEQGDRQQGLETCTITTRWGPSIAAIDSSWWATRKHPVTGELERFNFKSVRNVGERNREIEIDAVGVKECWRHSPSSRSKGTPS